MVTIRVAQLQALGRVAFEQTAVAHVTRHFPRHAAALGPQGTRDAVNSAYRLANDFGFAGEREIMQFIDLTFMFGPDFPASQQCPWADVILNDSSRGDARNRMERLYDAAIAHLQQLAANTRSQATSQAAAHV